MIAGYRDKRTRDFAAGQRVKAFSGIERPARLKLNRLEAATAVKDLASLPGGGPTVTAIHPGEHLTEELKELGMSAAELARKLDVPTNRITGILNGQRAITADTALRLAHFFGTSAEFWLTLQSLYELRIAQKKAGRSIRALPRLNHRERVPA
jgi:addiction module HigA family antidote